MTSGKTEAERFNDDGDLENLNDELDEVSWSDIDDDFDSDDFNDNFDDINQLDTDDLAGVENPDLDSPGPAPRKKGKGGLFIIILGALGLVAGGLYMNGMAPFSPKRSIPSTQIKADVPSNSPAPIQQVETPQQEASLFPDGQEHNSGQEVDQQEILLEEQVDILTPMPGEGDLDTIELSSLEEADTLVMAESQNEMSNSDEGLTLDEALEEDMQLTQEPSLPLGEDANNIETVLEEEKLLTETEKEFLPKASELDIAEERPATLEEESLGSQLLENDTAENESINDIEQALTIPEEELMQDAVQDAILPEVNDEVPQQPLEEQLGEGTQSVVVEQEQDSALLEEAPQKGEESIQTEQKPASAEVKKVSEKPTAKELKTTVKTKLEPIWKLRSARPGNAVIYDSRGREMKTVEVGDSVAGIGKIRSISVVNGKWVVQGSQGKIVQ
jgi:intracellular multiplication protein IcmG